MNTITHYLCTVVFGLSVCLGLTAEAAENIGPVQAVAIAMPTPASTPMDIIRHVNLRRMERQNAQSFSSFLSQRDEMNTVVQNLETVNRSQWH